MIYEKIFWPQRAAEKQIRTAVIDNDPRTTELDTENYKLSFSQNFYRYHQLPDVPHGMFCRMKK